MWLRVVLAALARSAALDNGVGLTPAMGYNTWDDFRCGGITAANIQRVADAFTRYGLDKVGYQYVGIDDCWAVARNKSTGVIVEDPKAFPQGMKAVVDYVHARGLKLGIYTDRGTATCVGRPGSQGYERTDAETYAEWGVDLVKEDSCNAPTDHAEAFRQYGLMRDALNATGRPIYFALCGWSDWYAPQGRALGNSWRYGYDVNDWNSAWSNAITSSTRLAKYAGPGAWNDPDALIGSSAGTAVHLSEAQSRTQFSLWSIMAAPLEIGSNILNMSAYDLETYTNTEVIAVDQDPLGMQGRVVWENCGGRKMWDALQVRRGRRPGRRRSLDSAVRTSSGDSCTAIPGCQQIWLRRLRDGYALVFVNYTRSGLAAGSSSGKLRLEACNATAESQLWNVQTRENMSTIAALAGDGACWEVTGCNYELGASVDTNFGCKHLPSAGLTDPCCSNMAWSVNTNNSTITSVFGGKCFEVGASGGTLAPCMGGRSQKWQLVGKPGQTRIVSAAGGCVSHSQQFKRSADQRMVFDVSASLGWGAAAVRDLWDHTDLGVETKIAVALKGDGDSKMFKITEASPAAFI